MARVITEQDYSSLAQDLLARAAKQGVAAGNLANLDTPGYRAKEVSFGDLLDGEVKRLGLTTTSQNQLPGVGETTPETRDAEELTSRRDGNNVQLDHELLTMTRATSDFTAAQTALSAKFRVIRFAINEGR